MSGKGSSDVLLEMVDFMTTFWADNWTRMGRVDSNIRMEMVLFMSGLTVAGLSQLHLTSHQVQGSAEHGDGDVAAGQEGASDHGEQFAEGKSLSSLGFMGDPVVAEINPTSSVKINHFRCHLREGFKTCVMMWSCTGPHAGEEKCSNLVPHTVVVLPGG